MTISTIATWTFWYLVFVGGAFLAIFPQGQTSTPCPQDAPGQEIPTYRDICPTCNAPVASEGLCDACLEEAACPDCYCYGTHAPNCFNYEGDVFASAEDMYDNN